MADSAARVPQKGGMGDMGKSSALVFATDL